MPGIVHSIANWPGPFVAPSNEYGAIYSKDSSATTLLSRQGSAVGLSATAGVGLTPGVSSFDNIAPWKDIKLCNVRAEGVVAYEGDAAFKRDGSNGDVMVEIPKFYYKLVDTATLTEYFISATPKPGYKVSPMHSYWNGELPKTYVSAYTLNTSYASIAGAAPHQPGRQTARPGIRAKGSQFFMMDMRTWFTIQLLYLVEFANTNSQTVIGAGVTSPIALVNSGGADSVAGHTGSATGASGQVACKYRHMENLWGNANIGHHIDGIGTYTNRLNNYTAYYCDNPEQYTDITSATIPPGYVAGMNVGLFGVMTDVYYKEMAYLAGREWFCLPKASSPTGNGSNYMADATRNYYTTGTADTWGWGPMVGGGTNQGANAGLFCYRLDNGAAYSASGVLRSIYLPT